MGVEWRDRRRSVTPAGRCRGRRSRLDLWLYADSGDPVHLLLHVVETLQFGTATHSEDRQPASSDDGLCVVPSATVLSMPSPTLFDLPMGQLLERFGQGKATPGSGCAAALMALLSASLTSSVAKMTISKGHLAQDRDQSGRILRDLEENICIELKRLSDYDAEIFELVIQLRKERDSSSDIGRRRSLAIAATAQLRVANEILFDIANLAFRALEYGVAIHKIGYRPAMGDSGAGISAAYRCHIYVYLRHKREMFAQV